MTTTHITLTRAAVRPLSLLVAAMLIAVWSAPACRADPSLNQATPPTSSSDPWSADKLMEPQELTKTTAKSGTEKPLVLCVGYSVLYQNSHIVGALYAGPASKPEGIQALQRAVQALSPDKSIVLYCGCCPWKDCPNIRPAFRRLQELGFHHVRLLVLPTNFRKDWIDLGLPTEKGSNAHEEAH